MDAREQRGLEIAARCQITKKNGTWLVPSQSGHGKYAVFIDDKPTCTCPDHETRQVKCKHIIAVEYFIKREENPDGTTTVTETISVTKRKTYPQDWTNYNKAQVNEKDQFQTLLHDLCEGLEEPPQKMGRPRLSLADTVFSTTFKVYSTFSGRRFMSDLRAAHEKGYIRKMPHYNSIFRYLDTPALADSLKSLIIKSSLPLKSVESDFAVDSSGFSTCRFEKWFDCKYGKVRKQHTWVKTHLMVGVKTNVVTAVEIADFHAHDSPMLKPMLATTAGNFTIREVSGDKAYLGKANMKMVEKVGALPFIMFKTNTLETEGTDIWSKMFHFFNFNRDAFLDHYHKRSNVESTISMIKAKFGDAVRSKTDVAQVNEVLCKVLGHNICCLIHAMYELGIAPAFQQAAV